MNAQWGLYAQDAWTLKRLTINYGLRWEYFHSSIAAEASTARACSCRSATFGPEDMPIWKTWSPRLGIVYDLFGDREDGAQVQRQQVPAVGDQRRGGRAQPDAAPVGVGHLAGSERRRYRRRDRSAARSARPGCEMNFAQLPRNFGLITPGCSTIATAGSIPCGTSQVDPNIERPIRRRLQRRRPARAVAARVGDGELHPDEFLQPVAGDQHAAELQRLHAVHHRQPARRAPDHLYNVSAAKVSAVQNLNTTDPQGARWNSALEFGFNARLPRGATLFGGVASDKTLLRQCDGFTNPQLLLYCDQTGNGIPWNTQFKIAGSMPLPYGIQLGASYTTYKYTYGTAVANTNTTYGSVWLITPTTRYAGELPGACTPGALVDPGMTVANMSIPLVPPGTEFSDRIQQLDITAGKWIDIGKLRIQPAISLFNALNNHAVFAVRSMNYLTSSYLQPSTVLQPRLLRLEVQVKW